MKSMLTVASAAEHQNVLRTRPIGWDQWQLKCRPSAWTVSEIYTT